MYFKKKVIAASVYEWASPLKLLEAENIQNVSLCWSILNKSTDNQF